jgi:PTH2 family peptidyl-tRNA hydrolase
MASKQVIVVRKDLKMNKGKIGAQVAHASLGALLKTKRVTTEDRLVLAIDSSVRDWLDGPFTKIVLACDSLAEILELEKRCKQLGVRCCLITDAGNTVFHNVPTVTCLAVGPAEETEVDKITGNLKLL